MRLKSLAIAVAIAGAASVGLASHASATIHTLTFDQGVACGATACGDGTALSQNYGDLPGLDVHYRSLTGIGNSPVANDAMYSWGTAYGDLTDVAYASGGDCCSYADITFTVTDPNLVFTLISMDFAGWPHTARDTSARLYTLDYSSELGSISFTAPGDTHFHLNCFACSTSQGYHLQFGPSAYNVGIDNIQFDLSPAQGGVPEPAAWALMLVGFGAMGAMVRRRRTALAA